MALVTTSPSKKSAKDFVPGVAAAPQEIPTAPGDAASAKPTAPAQSKAKVTVTPVYGPMHHLFLNKRIEGPTEFEEIDGWLRAQIDAGKLTVQ